VKFSKTTGDAINEYQKQANSWTHDRCVNFTLGDFLDAWEVMLPSPRLSGYSTLQLETIVDEMRGLFDNEPDLVTMPLLEVIVDETTT